MSLKTLKSRRGRLRTVALVGIDGSGKSTQVRLLGRRLADQRKRVVVIHPFGRKLLNFPGSVPGGPAPELGHSRGRPRLFRRLAGACEILDIAGYIWAMHTWCKALAFFTRREVWLVSDRSFDDLLIKHRRLGTFSWPLLSRLRGLVPHTQATIWLSTEPEVARSRDGDFGPLYYQELHVDYESVARELCWQVISTSDRTREAIATDVASALKVQTPSGASQDGSNAEASHCYTRGIAQKT